MNLGQCWWHGRGCQHNVDLCTAMHRHTPAHRRTELCGIATSASSPYLRFFSSSHSSCAGHGSIILATSFKKYHTHSAMHANSTIHKNSLSCREPRSRVLVRRRKLSKRRGNVSEPPVHTGQRCGRTWVGRRHWQGTLHRSEQCPQGSARDCTAPLPESRCGCACR